MLKSIQAKTTIIIAVMLGAMFSVVALNGCGQTDNAALNNPASGDVGSRQKLMKEWHSANNMIKGMADNPSRFDSAVLKEQTSFLQQSTQTMWAYFGDQTAKGNTREEAWSDPTAFKAKTDQFDAITTALNAAAQTATQSQDIQALSGQLHESCGTCHKAFRQR